MTTVPSEFDSLGYLQKAKTRDGFFANKYNISKSQSTVHNCKASLKSFDRFVFAKFGKNSTERVISDIKKFPKYRQEQAIIDLLQEFVNWKNQESMASTSRLYYRVVTEYFAYHGVKIHPQDLRRGVRLPKDPRNLKHAITVPEIKKIVDFSKPKRKALYTTLLSSGMRIGEVVGIRKRDLDTSQERICITIPAKLTKKKVQRQTFVSKEAETYLLPIIRRLHPDDLVFGSNDDTYRSVENEELIFWKLRKQIGLDERYDNSRMYKINIHSFRSFCETRASNIHGVEYAHALIGHSGYLEQYYRITPEERIEKYLQLEPHLIIGEDFRKSLKIERLEAEKSELERKNGEIQEYLMKVDELWADKQRMENFKKKN